MTRTGADRVSTHAPFDGSSVSREYTVERAPFWDVSTAVRRMKSLSDLQKAVDEKDSLRSKRHFLQTFPRRTSFAGTLPPQPHALEHLNIGFSENGIHSCSYCEKVDLDVRGVRSWRDPGTWFNSPLGYLNVTCKESEWAARSGCPLFYLLTSNNRCSREYWPLRTGRPRRVKIPDKPVNEPMRFLIGERKKKETHGTMVRFEKRFRSGDKLPSFGIGDWFLIQLKG